MKTLYIECHMGAAGDMLMSALYELLEDKEGFLNTMNGLGLPGVHLEAVQGASGGISGTHMKVTVHGQEELEHDHDHHHHHDHEHPHDHDHHHDHDHEHHHDHEHDHAHDHSHGHEHDHDHEHHHHHATPGHIAEIIDALALPDEVKANARGVYDAIAQAEAKAHGCPVGDVHYHEVGALDAVADVTGVCYAISLLKPDRVVVSPIHVGGGTVKCAHGVMPVPAPATANLLSGVPVYGGEVMGELCTPTGAALLTHFAQSFGPMPPMTVDAVGCGVGTKVFAGRANCVRVFLGEDAQEANGTITELVCNIDDMTPEALAFAASRLLELGALDVYTVPGTMKKGRSGHVLTVLCEGDREKELARAVMEQTTTNGLRVRRCAKYFLTPGSGTVETRWGTVRLKTAQGYGVRHVTAEYESVAELARANGLPIQTVLEDVQKHL